MTKHLSWVLFVALFATAFAAQLADAVSEPNSTSQDFPGYSDADTAALWLFDEALDPPVPTVEHVTPWYYAQTLIDASDNYYDLHLLHGGAIEPGHFGHALRTFASKVGPGMQLAANFASEPRVFGVFSTADHEFVPGSEKERESVANYFWYTVRPDQFVDAVQGPAWTIETWLRYAGAPNETGCLLDAGQGRDTTVRVELIDHASVARITIPKSGIAVDVKLPADRLSDGNWHHVAWVKPADRQEIATFVDGKVVSATSFTAAEAPTTGPLSPGLVARTFRGLDFDGPLQSIDVPNLGDAMGKQLDGAKSVRLRGWIRAPFDGAIRFETDAESGLHLDLDQRPLMYGWFGRAALYKRSPRWGTITLKKGEVYPVFIEMQRGDGDLDLDKQRLYWSWVGTDKQQIPASAWLHSAFDETASADDQGGGFSPEALMKSRFNLTLGSNREGAEAIDGWLDELRISSVARYTDGFTPATHSLHFGPEAPSLAEANGPPLLFTVDQTTGPIELGSRKYLFIDDALLDKSSGLEFVVNSPHDPEQIQPVGAGGDHSFFELRDQVALFAPAGYEGREDYAYLWTSDDGVHFSRHGTKQAADGSEAPEPIHTRVPAWGRMALDTNPNTPDWARFKYTAGVPNRGICLLVSPDAVHWRRNETIMLQVGTGGESHWYWDDQRGEYRFLLKWDHGPGGRQSVEAVTRDFYEPWPLPVDGGGALGLTTPLGFMPTRIAPDDELGEVYRSRAVKYPWAPDAYVAFVWRFDRVTNARQVELAASRDGENWKYYGKQWYMPAEFPFNGEQIHEVTSVDGMIRRGDELWQYFDFSTGRHDGSFPAWRVRMTQRLDGFVSLDAGGEKGSFTTKPFKFAGDSLQVNLAVDDGGSARFALLDANGQPIAGYSLDDCDPVHGDSTAHDVTWRGKKMNLGELAGRSVRLQGELQNAKLYALQFE